MGYTGVITYLQTIYYNFLGHPREWYIYLCEWLIFYGKCVDKYTIPMDPMGYTGRSIGILVTACEIIPLYNWIV